MSDLLLESGMVTAVPMLSLLASCRCGAEETKQRSASKAADMAWSRGVQPL